MFRKRSFKALTRSGDASFKTALMTYGLAPHKDWSMGNFSWGTPTSSFLNVAYTFLMRWRIYFARTQVDALVEMCQFSFSDYRVSPDEGQRAWSM